MIRYGSGRRRAGGSVSGASGLNSESLHQQGMALGNSCAQRQLINYSRVIQNFGGLSGY